MPELSFEDDVVILKFPKHLITNDYLQQLLERLQLEAWLEKSSLSEENAWELSEQLKSEWWESNKLHFLRK